MQAEQQKTEEAPRPTPEEELTTRGLLPDEEERHKELLAKKAQKEKRHEKLSKADARELDALTTIKQLEYDRQAAIHKLSETADKFGRKKIGAIRRDVTGQVKALSDAEHTEAAGIKKIYTKGQAEMVKEMKAAMQRVQETHNKALADLQAQRELDEEEVRQRYRKQYDGHEAQMKADEDEASALVADFIRDIQELELEQLQELVKTGIVQVGGNRKNRDYLVVPGAEK